MLASFKIKDSKVSLNGIDISGVGNTLEVLIHGNISEVPGSRLVGKTATLVKQKAFFKVSDIRPLEEVCEQLSSRSYSFSREQLQYEMENVEIILSKYDCIAGVVPVELAVSSDDKPTCKRVNALLE